MKIHEKLENPQFDFIHKLNYCSSDDYYNMNSRVYVNKLVEILKNIPNYILRFMELWSLILNYYLQIKARSLCIWLFNV